MESYLLHAHYDLVTPDGLVTALSDDHRQATLRIEGISPAFLGFQLEPELVQFNLKSTLAQLSVDGVADEIHLDPKEQVAEVKVTLTGIGKLGAAMLDQLTVGAAIGKLFAADPRRRVRDPDYLFRMFGRSDRWGKPLLSLGSLHGSDALAFEVIDGRTVAYIRLLEGPVVYDEAVYGLLPTVGQALVHGYPVRDLIRLHQSRDEQRPRLVSEEEMLLLQTPPLHVRTVFGSVVNQLLPKGYRHTSASILQPDTSASGDIYEMHGSSSQEINDVPLEFYTLEPHREYVFFQDRDQLQSSLEDPQSIFDAFETMPKDEDQAAIFVVKGEQMLDLKPSDWITRDVAQHEFPGFAQGTRQAMMVERYIEKQASYPFLRCIENGLITSEGVLFTRYFPSPVMKRLLLSDVVHRCLKGIYFEIPSYHHGEFFSFEDRALLIDLAKFAIPVHWVDERTKTVLRYIQRPDKDSGMFVPLDKVNTFARATFFGIYGSNLLAGNFEKELTSLLQEVTKLKESLTHPLLNPDTPLAMVTGGGPGAMEVGNKVAQATGVLSCANIVDLRASGLSEQAQNPHVEAKMTYRLDKLVERQAEFHLDFPIFLQGGIGTDFEFALEQVRRKVGATPPYPVLLLGDPNYWRAKITPPFQCNLKSGTIKGSEWVGNVFYCVQTADQACDIYRRWCEGTLPIGSEGPVYDDGFVASI
jgi:predicted Rossmann-fold nucleotide-binding protein